MLVPFQFGPTLGVTAPKFSESPMALALNSDLLFDKTKENTFILFSFIVNNMNGVNKQKSVSLLCLK